VCARAARLPQRAAPRQVGRLHLVAGAGCVLLRARILCRLPGDVNRCTLPAAGRQAKHTVRWMVLSLQATGNLLVCRKTPGCLGGSNPACPFDAMQCNELEFTPGCDGSVCCRCCCRRDGLGVDVIGRRRRRFGCCDGGNGAVGATAYGVACLQPAAVGSRKRLSVVCQRLSSVLTAHKRSRTAIWLPV
jgi:hypothetical protein